MSKLAPYHAQLLAVRTQVRVEFQPKGKYNAVEVLQRLYDDPQTREVFEQLLELYDDPSVPNKVAGEITKFFGGEFPEDHLPPERAEWKLTDSSGNVITLPDGRRLCGTTNLVHQKTAAIAD